MDVRRIRDRFMAAYVVFAFAVAGFVGFMIVEDALNEGGAEGAVIIVDQGGGGNYTKIQDAINSTTSGTIHIWEGTFYEHLKIDSNKNNITLIGNGTDKTIINGSGWGGVVRVYCDDFSIQNITVTNGDDYEDDEAGDSCIEVQGSTNSEIRNCSFSNTLHGVTFKSGRNYLIDNNTFSNVTIGVNCKNLKESRINNNTIQANSSKADRAGIQLTTGRYNVITNNSMVQCGIDLTRCDLISLYSSDIDTTNQVNGRSVYYWKDTSDSPIPPNAGQVVLYNCTNVSLQGLNLSDGSLSVMTVYSDNLTITDNLCNDNGRKGILLVNSENCTIQNNNCTNDTVIGVGIESSNHIILDNNTCNDNWVGIYLGRWAETSVYSPNITITNNVCNWNDESGISVGYWNQYIANNTCNYNDYGMEMYVKNSVVRDNICKYNRWDGMKVYGRASYFENNICNNNSVGMRFIRTESNDISNNTCSGNPYYGIQMEGDFSTNCSFNSLTNNELSHNGNGTRLHYHAHLNTISFNNITDNTYYGLLTTINSSYNDIHHNNFVSNGVQAIQNGINYWNDSKQEGNFWSDYFGLDNGAGGRTKDDGVGDTEIPHLGLDSYPLTEPVGWVLPDAPGPPENISVDEVGGTYLNISWDPSSSQDVRGFRVYINETGSTISFYYLGTTMLTIFNATALASETTYHFNITAYDTYSSESVPLQGNGTTTDITPPAMPSGLVVTDVGGDYLSLSWSPSSSGDVQGYQVYMNETGSATSFRYHINTSETSFNVTGLEEEEDYYFKVRAYDEVPLFSPLSGAVSKRTLDTTPPAMPTGLRAYNPTGTTIDLNWNRNPELDIVGYLIFINDVGAGGGGPFHQIAYVNDPGNYYRVLGLTEEETYYFTIIAHDDVPNNSPNSTTVKGTTLDVTAPGQPTHVQVVSPTPSSLTITWDPSPATDVQGYIIYESLYSYFYYYYRVNDGLVNVTSYNVTGLEEDRMYYYKVTAVDEVPNESTVSYMASGRTLLGPKPPYVKKPATDISMNEDSIDQTLNLNKVFDDANGDLLEYTCTRYEHVNVTIDPVLGVVSLEPERNWNGVEELTFFASDGALECNDTITVTVLAVNDPPDDPVILSPLDGAVFEYGTTFAFEGQCDDPDIPYGEELSFTWSSNTSGKLGDGETLKGGLLPFGHHRITLTVEDKVGKTSESSVDIIILSPSKPGDGEDSDGEDPGDGGEPADGEDPDDGDGTDDADGTDPEDGEDGIDDPNGTDGIDPTDGTDDTTGDDKAGMNAPLVAGIVAAIIVAVIASLFILMKLRGRKPLVEPEPQSPMPGPVPVGPRPMSPKAPSYPIPAEYTMAGPEMEPMGPMEPLTPAPNDPPSFL